MAMPKDKSITKAAAVMGRMSAESRHGELLSVAETQSITQSLITSGWTQVQIGAAVARPQSAVSRWARGLSAGPATLRELIAKSPATLSTVERL